MQRHKEDADLEPEQWGEDKGDGSEGDGPYQPHEVREEWEHHGHEGRDHNCAATQDDSHGYQLVRCPPKLLLHPILKDLEHRLGKHLPPDRPPAVSLHSL